MKNILLFLLFIYLKPFAQSIEVTKVEPPNWWTGMKYNSVQLMIYGKNLDIKAAECSSPAITITKIHNIKNKSYAFIDIEISNKAQPDDYTITLSNNNDKTNIKFPLYSRNISSFVHQGFSSEDILYLITPDRFANGDESNDNNPLLFDSLDRDDDYGRHGGDIQGIINNIDYIKESGVTALWINPLLENNMRESYHGYAATDLYRIDARFGTNDLYKNLVEKSHQNGLKVIMDHINNHIGIHHQWVNNIPMPEWFNGTPDNFFLTDHNKVSVTDIHSDESVKEKITDGWFVSEMPDMNQKNPYVAKYFIQNTLWWIEFSGIDGIREDTYFYPDQKYLSEWAEIILNEYPSFNLVGELWIGDPAYLAPYQSGNLYNYDYDTNLPSLTDFPLMFAIRDVMEDRGITNLYRVISKDHLYTNPYELVIFGDNHDLERIMYRVNGDVKKLKMVLTILLTTRGIPQIYYGTEIGMIGGKGHGALREDFPGGFPGDERNAFTSSGRTKEENEIFNFFKNLTSIRKEHKALSLGKLLHYPPVDEVYYYFRIYDDEIIMITINNSESPKKIILPEDDFLTNAKGLKNLQTGLEINATEFEIDSYEAAIYLLTE